MSSLFGNRQEANLKTCEQMVEAVLTARGLDAGRHRIESHGGPAWGVTAGSAEVFIFLTAGSSGDNFIQVVAPVMTPPQEELTAQRLLRARSARGGFADPADPDPRVGDGGAAERHDRRDADDSVA